MKKTLLVLVPFLFLFAACNNTKKETTTTEETAFSVDMDKTSMKFTAFKTPEKIGVSGSFDDISLENNEFTINTYSVNTGNPERDLKLKTFFFSSLSDSLITGSYGTLKEGILPVTLKMNGEEKTVDFTYNSTDTLSTLTGSIDVVSDFSGSIALEAINKACFDLHAGKTWSTVDLEVAIKP